MGELAYNTIEWHSVYGGGLLRSLKAANDDAYRLASFYKCIGVKKLKKWLFPNV